MHIQQAVCGMQVITDPQEKDEALEALVEHIIPGESEKVLSCISDSASSANANLLVTVL